LCACSGCFLLSRQGGAPGITYATAPTHGGAVCVVWPLSKEGRCGCPSPKAIF
jgi:hypothetical protein